MSGGLAQQLLPLFQLASTSVFRKIVCLGIFFDGRWGPTSHTSFDKLHSLATSFFFSTVINNSPSFPASCLLLLFPLRFIAMFTRSLSLAAITKVMIQLMSVYTTISNFHNLKTGPKAMLFVGEWKLSKKLTLALEV